MHQMFKVREPKANTHTQTRTHKINAPHKRSPTFTPPIMKDVPRRARAKNSTDGGQSMLCVSTLCERGGVQRSDQVCQCARVLVGECARG